MVAASRPPRARRPGAAPGLPVCQAVTAVCLCAVHMAPSLQQMVVPLTKLCCCCRCKCRAVGLQVVDTHRTPLHCTPAPRHRYRTYQSQGTPMQAVLQHHCAVAVLLCMYLLTLVLSSPAGRWRLAQAVPRPASADTLLCSLCCITSCYGMPCIFLVDQPGMVFISRLPASKQHAAARGPPAADEGQTCRQHIGRVACFVQLCNQAGAAIRHLM